MGSTKPVFKSNTLSFVPKCKNFLQQRLTNYTFRVFSKNVSRHFFICSINIPQLALNQPNPIPQPFYPIFYSPLYI